METLRQLIKTNHINLHYHASYNWEYMHSDTLYIKSDPVVLPLSRNFSNYSKHTRLSAFRYTRLSALKLGFIARESVFSNTLSAYKSSNNENEKGCIYE